MDDFNQEAVQPVSFEEEKTLVLRKPVVLGSVTYAELNLREPTAGELSKATKAGSNVDTAISLIGLIAKVPRRVVEELCQRDFQEANEYLSGFTYNGPETGETSSLT
jgi:hypothetical protein